MPKMNHMTFRSDDNNFYILSSADVKELVKRGRDKQPLNIFDFSQPLASDMALSIYMTRQRPIWLEKSKTDDPNFWNLLQTLAEASEDNED